MRSAFIKFGCVCAIAMLSHVVRADQVENPAYKTWAKFGVGSSSTMTMKTETAGQSVNTEMKQTLVSVDDTKAVVEMKTSMQFNGQTIDQPAQKIEIQKMVDTAAPAAGAKNVDPKALENAKAESVTVKAGTYDAKLIESSGDAAGSKYNSKVWYTEEVPGGVVKMETTTDGPVKSTVSSELTAVDKK